MREPLPHMRAYSGKTLDFFTPDPSAVDYRDISRGLSRAARYCGQTSRFYSVAEHSCILSDWVMNQEGSTPEDGLIALLHDAAEAYIGDVVAPLKCFLGEYKVVEGRIEQAIALAFHLPTLRIDWIKAADCRIVRDEVEQLIPGDVRLDRDPLGVSLWPVRGRFPWLVRQEWEHRFHNLQAQRFS